jgi:sulfur carrier protein
MAGAITLARTFRFEANAEHVYLSSGTKQTVYHYPFPMSTIHITLNGERKEIPAGSTVAELLVIADAGRQPVAVVVNEHIVRPDQRDSCILQDQDQVEILVFAGGG